MNQTRISAVAAALVLCAASVAWADALPDGAKPISAKWLAKYYAGKSADWDSSKAYFAPDGTVKGINTSDGGKSIFWGKWSAKGNEVCMVNSWKNLSSGKTGSGSTDCWKWYAAADGTLWQLWSVHYDGTKPGKDDYYAGEDKKLRKGDIVSKTFDKLNG